MKNSKIIRRWLVTIGLVICLFGVSFADKGKIAATVNGVEITRQKLLSKINEKLPLITVHQRISEKRFSEIREQILNQLIDEELLVQEAKRRGIKVTRDELNRQINLMKSRYPDQKIFEQELSKTGQSYKQWVEKVKRRLLIRKLWQVAVTQQVHVTDRDVYAYYLKNKKKFYIPDRLHLAHILIAVEPGAMEAGWKKGLDKANNLYRQLSRGADFASMARRYSADSTSAKQGGDLGWRHVGQLLPALDTVAKTLKVGQISKPVRTIYGYHILKLIAKEPGRQLSFEEIDKNSLKKRLQKKEVDKLGQELLRQLRAKASIRIYTNTTH